MAEWLIVLGLASVAGLAMPAGACLARIERIRPNWLDNELRHGVIAFGGGALLSAVALVLVPEGIHGLSTLSTALCFSGGGLAFMALDIALANRESSASQLTAMLADFLPESLALGATFALGGQSAPLLAGLIALQNLPEGFNAYREQIESGPMRGTQVIAAFALLALLGPVAALSGYFWLAGFPVLVSSIMLFAAGGILYAIFQDIAPQAKLERNWAPSLGAVAGFLLGLIGHMYIS
jgi:ZIP family zinc transporter